MFAALLLTCVSSFQGPSVHARSLAEWRAAIAPSGEFLDSFNTNDPGRVARMPDRTLEAWRDPPRECRTRA
ncbi:MAG: hypothetical protein L6Q99_20100 [Planctomycetes bacterium]|nr:hypothetical protein [Planctomycetota bacterium]